MVKDEYFPPKMGNETRVLASAVRQENDIGEIQIVKESLENTKNSSTYRCQDKNMKIQILFLYTSNEQLENKI